MNEDSDKFNKECRKYKEEPKKLKNEITYKNITLGGINSRLDNTEEGINELQDNNRYHSN